jgi:hypothetical protein
MEDVLLSRWLSSSMDVLRMANTLRSEGRLPAATSIWAVENPLRHHPSRLAAKVGLQPGHCCPVIPCHGCPCSSAFAPLHILGGEGALLLQIEAGAEAIVTQPPLAWGRFEEWYEEVDR